MKNATTTTRWTDRMILEAVRDGHMMTRPATDRAFELIDLGYIDATGTWKLSGKALGLLAAGGVFGRLTT